jgi:nitroimidazol reductase NimA-like FMN-containing flavoprotein (pyridoxamine 5'-phosphate oxidase superfamily)
MSDTTIEHRWPGPKTDRARIRRHAERGVPDRIEEILDAGHVAHVGYTVDGEPRVIPFLYHYEDGRIVLHGHAASQTLARLRKGVQVAVSVTLVDGLIASRDAENHSANYRSVVAYGTTRRVTDIVEKRRLLDAMTARYFPGRTVGQDYAAATDQQLLALEVVEVVIEEAAAKARAGGPMGPRDHDPAASGTLGIFDLDGVTRLG